MYNMKCPRIAIENNNRDLPLTKEYRIHLIRRRGYYLFHRPSLCGIYSRAATIGERHLLIPVAAREEIFRETVD